MLLPPFLLVIFLSILLRSQGAICVSRFLLCFLWSTWLAYLNCFCICSTCDYNDWHLPTELLSLSLCRNLLFVPDSTEKDKERICHVLFIKAVLKICCNSRWFPWTTVQTPSCYFVSLQFCFKTLHIFVVLFISKVKWQLLTSIWVPG